MNRSLQHLSLQIRNRLLRKQEALRQGHLLTYAQVRQVGLLFRAPKKEQAMAVDLLIKGLLNDGKSVSAFTFLDNEPSPECKVAFKSFRPTDIDQWGRIKLELVNRFIDTPLDYLICISTGPSTEFEHLILRSKAYCRIGNSQTGMPHLFDLVFDTEGHNPEEAATAILGYLRMLSGDWVRPVYLG
jgi:hypothetical protein